MYRRTQRLQLPRKDSLVDSGACCRICYAEILELKQSERVFKVNHFKGKKLTFRDYISGLRAKF